MTQTLRRAERLAKFHLLNQNNRLEKLYREKGISEICSLFSITEKVAYPLLKDAGISVNSADTRREKSKKINQQRLSELENYGGIQYLYDNFGVEKIAEYLNGTIHIVYPLLKFAKINTSFYPHHARVRKYGEDNLEQLKNTDFIKNLYETGGLSLIMDTLGTRNAAALRFLRKAGIEPKGHQAISKFETEVYEFIKSIYDGIIKINDRTILGNRKHLDIYIPDINLAIECNGSYWHGEKAGRDKNYHIDKTNICNEKGIRLIHVWEHDWKFRKDIIKSMLKNTCMKFDIKLHASNCEIREINKIDSNKFLNENHIQGSCRSAVQLGMYHDNELVSVMHFSKSKFNKEFEIVRFVSKLYHDIIGADLALLVYFERKYKPKSIILYVSRDYETGQGYEKLGFTFTKYIGPNFYVTCDHLTFHNRIRFHKHKLEKTLKTFDPNITTWENLKNNGYDRIWDTGQKFFVKRF